METGRRVVIKIGSNVLTRADGMLDVTRLSALVDQLAELRNSGYELIVVSSGAVAAGRSEMRRTPPGRLDSVSARQLFSAVGQAKLINRYYDLFREHGIPCGQILATKENFDRRLHYLNMKNCMDTMLANGVLPIVNENDTVSVTELMFTDNDELSGLIAAMMDADTLIILSNIDGFYTGDPAGSESVIIPRIGLDDDPTHFIANEKSTFGRGGMASKCRIARLVASDGIEVIIANGKREGILPALCKGADVPHTVFEAAPERQSGIKKWIAHSGSFAKGTLHVNEGAVEALQRPGVSLLPVGVTDISGDFDADDIVRVVAPGGEVLGWGKVTLDSHAALKVLGRTGERPLIHADYLYLE